MNQGKVRKIMIKHQQVHGLEANGEKPKTHNTKSLMFVLENKINKQHVYRWSRKKTGPTLMFVFGMFFLYVLKIFNLR